MENSICDGWGEGSGLELWDTECNTYSTEKTIEASFGYLATEETLKNRVEEMTDSMYSHSRVDEAQWRTQEDVKNINFNLLIIIIAISVLLINIIIISLGVMVCRLHKKRVKKKRISEMSRVPQNCPKTKEELLTLKRSYLECTPGSSTQSACLIEDTASEITNSTCSCHCENYSRIVKQETPI